VSDWRPFIYGVAGGIAVFVGMTAIALGLAALILDEKREECRDAAALLEIRCSMVGNRCICKDGSRPLEAW
jgi:hypothetical protein